MVRVWIQLREVTQEAERKFLLTIVAARLVTQTKESQKERTDDLQLELSQNPDSIDAPQLSLAYSCASCFEAGVACAENTARSNAIRSRAEHTAGTTGKNPFVP